MLHNYKVIVNYSLNRIITFYGIVQYLIRVVGRRELIDLKSDEGLWQKKAVALFRGVGNWSNSPIENTTTALSMTRETQQVENVHNIRQIRPFE